MQLIAYASRFGGNIRNLHDILNNELQGLFSGVHLLPFFDPIDGADAGFDPIDHTRVDPSVGCWSDVKALTADYNVMADMIVNHVSSDSLQFRDVVSKGNESEYWDMFLKSEDIFPATNDNSLASAEIEKIFRPRPGEPFTAYTLSDGCTVHFWTTFTARQIDINVNSAVGTAYLDSILLKFASAGIRTIRLDAAGYVIKRRGTSCFMLPETFDFIASLSAKAADLGMTSLVEVHSHYRKQITIASCVNKVYDFALPPLILHTLFTSNADACKRWLTIAPRNCVTVLDTHDGIGILDVTGEGELEGLLADDQVIELVDTIHKKTQGASRNASGHTASNLDVYQVNSTYYDALGRSDRDYLIARAIQFFAPGDPQIYYTGLLAGHNDTELFEHSGVGRDINRHYYSIDDIRAALSRPVVQSLIGLIRLRNSMLTIDSDFSLPECGRDELVMRWDGRDGNAQLNVWLKDKIADIKIDEGNTTRRYRITDTLQNIA